VPDPRPVRTRRRLLDAGRALIAERGEGGLRIAEITERAGVALGSFQNHFSSKKELVEAVIVETIQTLAAQIVDGPDMDHDESAVTAVTALRKFVRLAYEEPAFCRTLVNLSHSEQVFVEAIRPYAHMVLERAVKAGAFEIDNIDLATTFTVGGTLAVIRRVLDGHAGPCADTQIAYATLLSFGVDPHEARRLSSLRQS
jgi:AcrR family transcriptional regulator